MLGLGCGNTGEMANGTQSSLYPPSPRYPISCARPTARLTILGISKGDRSSAHLSFLHPEPLAGTTVAQKHRNHHATVIFTSFLFRSIIRLIPTWATFPLRTFTTCEPVPPRRLRWQEYPDHREKVYSFNPRRPSEVTRRVEGIDTYVWVRTTV